jgi:hypothetical protein
MTDKEKTVLHHEPLYSLHHAGARLCPEIDQQVPAEHNVVGPFAREDTIIQKVPVDEAHSVPSLVLQNVLAPHGHKISITKRLRYTAKGMLRVGRALRFAEKSPADVQRIYPVLLGAQSGFLKHHGDGVRLFSTGTGCAQDSQRPRRSRPDCLIAYMVAKKGKGDLVTEKGGLRDYYGLDQGFHLPRVGAGPHKILFLIRQLAGGHPVPDGAREVLVAQHVGINPCNLLQQLP